MCTNPKISIISSQANLTTLTGANAEIHGDFNQTGKIDKNQSERDKRYKRPGAIILPNLNLSAGLPAGSPNVDLSNRRDADNTTIENANDLGELTKIIIQSPSAGTLEADQLVFHVDPKDVDRFHLFEDSGGAPNTLKVAFGKSKGNDQPLSIKTQTSFELGYYLEGLTLPGSPMANPSATPPKAPPEVVGTDTSGNLIFSTPSSPIYKTRGPGEIWLELQHKRGGKILPNNGDLALFLLARFILQANTEHCERIYVTYLKSAGNKPENHDFVYDLMEACWEVFSVGGPGTFKRPSSLEFKASKPADLSGPDTKTAGSCCLSPGKLYLINGDKYSDEWVQDEFEMGYCCRPGKKGFNIAVHLKRDRAQYDAAGNYTGSVEAPLANFVRNELAHSDIGLFTELAGSPQDGMDFGGNVEVSPPVMAETKAQKKCNAGPSFPDHPKAPFGKILIGDFKNSKRPSSGKIHDQIRTFLHDQLVQPIVPFNTSWLGVGHIDEVMSFVPSNRSRGSALCIASVFLMDRLIEETVKISVKDGRTNFHRGKFEDHRDMAWAAAGGGAISSSMWNSYAEISAEDLYNGEVRKYSQRIRNTFMIPIEERLKAATLHTGDDVIKVPIYFKPGKNPSKPFGNRDNITVAETVGMVNMQVANNHLMVPKPFGPRMKRVDAENIVKKIVGTKIPVKSLPDKEFPFWAFPGISLERVALFFAQPDTLAERARIINKIKNAAASLPSALQTLVNNKKNEITAKNPGMPLSGGVFNAWYRLNIPENTVDIIETYMLTVLSNIGCHVHFVDDWYYHVGWGEAHCATNAKRTPHLDAKWWEMYDPDRDMSYKPDS
jgi:hypothetical protein